jgi:hypothetical protein
MEKTKVETTADVLVRAFEMADDIEHVIVIYQRKKPSDSPTGAIVGFVESNELTIRDANFMADAYKSWLWSSMEKDED